MRDGVYDYSVILLFIFQHEDFSWEEGIVISREENKSEVVNFPCFHGVFFTVAISLQFRFLVNNLPP
jgi:hypothetical protein